MYCWNYKVASSFLMALMFKSVTNGSELELGIQPWTLQNSMSPRTMAEWRLGAGAGASILVVRHPMVRLVSAYRDRIEGLKASLRIYQHIAQGEYIVCSSVCTLVSIQSAVLGLDRTDAHLRRVQTKTIRGQERPQKYSSRPVAVPSWREFVRFLLVTDKLAYVSAKLSSLSLM